VLTCKAPRVAVAVGGTPGQGAEGGSAAPPHAPMQAASEEANAGTDTGSAGSAPCGSGAWESVSVSGEEQYSSEEGPAGDLGFGLALGLAPGTGAAAGAVPLGASPLSKRLKRLGFSSQRNSQRSPQSSGDVTGAVTGAVGRGLVSRLLTQPSTIAAPRRMVIPPRAVPRLKRKGSYTNSTNKHTNTNTCYTARRCPWHQE